MNIFKMYMCYAICFMIFVSGSSSHMFCSSSGDRKPALIRRILTWPEGGELPACPVLCCAAGLLYLEWHSRYVVQPNQIAACIKAGQSHNWQPDLTFLHKYDYNEMFVPHPAQENPHGDRGEMQCSVSLARTIDGGMLSNVLAATAAAAAPEDQIMDECSLLDELEEQNQHSQRKALGAFREILPCLAPRGPLSSFNDNARVINNYRARLRCSNMAQEDVQRLASARVCLQLKSLKKQEQEEHDALTGIFKPTREEVLLRSRVHRTTIEKIDETMKKEKCDEAK